MTADICDTLIRSTQEVFETMSFLDVVAGEPIEEHCEIPGMDIAAYVCLAGEISGILVIHSTTGFALQCAELMSGGLSDPDKETLGDTAGELANMVAGTLKRRISSAADLFDISLPSLIYGHGHSLFYSGAKDSFPRLLVPFSIDGENQFYLELLYHKR